MGAIGMLVSHRKKFIYLKTRKTAGTTVEIFFERFCVPEGSFVESHATQQKITEAGIVGSRQSADWQRDDYYNHMSALALRHKLGNATFDSYHKFCVMRNPFDKVVSHFWGILHKINRDLSNEPFSKIKQTFVSFVVARVGEFNDRQIFMIDGRPAVDSFLRYEQLTSDLQNICDRLSIAFKRDWIGNYKSEARRRHEHFSEYYDAATRGLVEREFSWEIEHFGYDARSSGRVASG
jgi:hypothetical protein